MCIFSMVSVKEKYINVLQAELILITKKLSDCYARHRHSQLTDFIHLMFNV